VDASEAWKHPEKRSYFFGAHDDNRLQFTVGRDIRLDPSQHGDPLNYFIYPYAELDGKPFAVESKFQFQDQISNVDWRFCEWSSAIAWQCLPNCGKLFAMGNKDRRSREKKKPKKAPAPKVYQPTVTTINKPTAPKA
jgi:hypothetical protein